jgi:NIPSNAP
MTVGSTRLPDLADDPFCEMRIYSVAAGRVRDMESRVQGYLKTLFPKHGIRPLAGWSTMVSSVSPAFVYVTPWRNMNERSKSWAGFYSDPEWADVRSRTNAGSELVESFEVMFLRAVVPWLAPTGASTFYELMIQSTAIGKGASVLVNLTARVLPILQRDGARVQGVFEIMSGRPLPALVFVLGWDSLEQRSITLSKLDAQSAGETPLFLRAEHHLMRHVPVDWA